MLLLLLAACEPKSDAADSGDSAADDTSTDDTAVDFDESCFAQVVRVQLVCDCTTISVDWSGVTGDSAGASFTPDDVELAHWYIFNVPVSAMNTALCAGGDLAENTFAAEAKAGDVLDISGTSATVEVGDWSRETGVIALYDTAASDGADLWPRAAAVFNFDADTESDAVVIEGRGDVYTAP